MTKNELRKLIREAVEENFSKHLENQNNDCEEMAKRILNVYDVFQERKPYGAIRMEVCHEKVGGGLFSSPEKSIEKLATKLCEGGITIDNGFVKLLVKEDSQLDRYLQECKRKGELKYNIDYDNAYLLFPLSESEYIVNELLG